MSEKQKAGDYLKSLKQKASEERAQRKQEFRSHLPSGDDLARMSDSEFERTKQKMIRGY
jgi:hypothetical protein